MDNDTNPEDTSFTSESEAQTARMDEFFGDTPEAVEETKPIEPLEKENENMDEFYDQADALEDPDAPKEPSEVAPEEPVAEEPATEQETTEAPSEEAVEPVVDPNAKPTINDKDPFDAETMEKIREMSSDPHAGIKYAELRGELKEYKRQVAEIEANGINTPEMQEMKARADRVSELEVALQTANEKVSMYDYQSTPDYQQAIQAPFQAIASDATAIESTRGIPEGAIMRAISATDPQRQEAAIQEIMDTHSVSRRDEMRMYQMADAAVSLRARESELQKSSQDRMTDFKERQEAQSAYQHEQETSLYRKTLRDTFQQYEGTVSAFVDGEGKNKPEWGDAIKQSENLDFRDVELQAISAYALTAAPALAKENKSLASEVSKLKTLLGRHQAVKPPAPNSTASQAPPVAKANRDAGLSLADSLGRRLAAAGIT